MECGSPLPLSVETTISHERSTGKVNEFDPLMLEATGCHPFVVGRGRDRSAARAPSIVRKLAAKKSVRAKRRLAALDPCFWFFLLAMIPGSSHA